MHKKFMKYLRCPRTGQELELTVDESRESGFIISGSLATATTTYPIINGIPRFVDAEYYTDSFGFEWTRFPDLQFDRNNLSNEFVGYTKNMFMQATGFSEFDMAGKTIVEFGCGPGRFLDVVRRHDGIAIGIDLSMAVESARSNFLEDIDVLIVQGDILNPPFADNCCDAGYSIGVLHHTPAPSMGAHMLARTVKQDGEVAVCVYDKDSGYDYPSVFWFRKFFTLLKKKVGADFSLKLALGYSYLAAYFFHYILKIIQYIPFIGAPVAAIIRQFFIVSCDLPNARWRVLDTFDSITPEFASTHTPLEVSFWLTSAGCSQITQQPWGITAYKGTKSKNPHTRKLNRTPVIE